MEAFHGFQPPGLSFHAFGLGPADRFPVGSQHQAGTGIGQFDPIAAGFPDIEEKSLLDGVFMRSCLDKHPVFQKNIGGA